MDTVFVFTSDKRNWLLQGFARQWQKYAPPDTNVVVVGFKPPEFSLPANFSFYSLGDMANFPVEKWSNALITFLEECAYEFVPIFLEDYWLMRPVPTRALTVCTAFAAGMNALRVDLTTDRLYSGATLTDKGSVGSLDFFESGHSPYQLSLQASVWHRDQLLSLLVPGETPWQVEINGNQRLEKQPHFHVYGTRQWPFRYQIMVNKGELALDGSWMFPARQLAEIDIVDLRGAGCLPGVGVPYAR